MEDHVPTFEEIRTILKDIADSQKKMQQETDRIMQETA